MAVEKPGKMVIREAAAPEVFVPRGSRSNPTPKGKASSKLQGLMLVKRELLKHPRGIKAAALAKQLGVARSTMEKWIMEIPGVRHPKTVHGKDVRGLWIWVPSAEEVDFAHDIIRYSVR